MLAVVCKNFRNMCLKVYELDPPKLLLITGLAWPAALKKNKIKLDLSADIDMLLMVEKGIRREIFCSICQYLKFNEKYRKDYDKNNKLTYLQYWDVNNLYGWAMLQSSQ